MLKRVYLSAGLLIAFLVLTACSSDPYFNTEYQLKKTAAENAHSEYMSRQPFFNGDNAPHFVWGTVICIVIVTAIICIYKSMRAEMNK